MIPKLRTWDKTTNQMRSCYGFNELEREVYVCSVADDEFNGRLRTVHALKRNFDEVVLMQSSGVKDKNGVEIYEGDVVSANDGLFEGEIQRIGACFVAQLIDSCNGYFFQPADWLNDYQNVIEVIDNIYENPELLEVTK